MTSVDIRETAAAALWRELVDRMPSLDPEILNEIESAIVTAMDADLDAESRAAKETVLLHIARARHATAQRGASA